jgi:hypothetical protein
MSFAEYSLRLSNGFTQQGNRAMPIAGAIREHFGRLQNKKAFRSRGSAGNLTARIRRSQSRRKCALPCNTEPTERRFCVPKS